MSLHPRFEDKYRFSKDPWDTLGEEKQPYYAWLLERVASHRGSSVLDVGCGEGHFTAQIHRRIAGTAFGADVSDTAVRRAQTAYPEVHFSTLDFAKPTTIGRSFDLIVCSQVLYYLSLTELSIFFQNVYDHLSERGLVILAANCSGGQYFAPEEFRGICSGALEEVAFDYFRDHRLFVGRKRPVDVAVTVDYEVGEHSESLRLSPDRWEREVIAPTARLMDVCKHVGAPLTIFVEMGQYWFLKEHAAATAARIEDQLRRAVADGHDVQVHLHSRWLVEAGARALPSGGIDVAMQHARIHDLPSELQSDVLARAKQELERLLRPVDAGYTAVCFRAGKYQIQPHDLVFKLLKQHGYLADSTVWHGGFLSAYDGKPGFDFRTLWHPSKSYWPNPVDINRPSTRHRSHGVIEIPILARDRSQWSFDTLTCDQIVAMFQEHTAGGGVRVMIGHSKNFTEAVARDLSAALVRLSELGVQFVTLRSAAASLQSDPRLESEIAALASFRQRALLSPRQLLSGLAGYHKRKAHLVADTISATTGENGPVRVLDVGCGTGELLTFPVCEILSQRVPFEMLGVDTDAASIDRAQERLAMFPASRLRFECRDIGSLNELFDVVLCSEVLEHLRHPEEFVAQLASRVAPNGRLVITVPNGYGYKELERRVLTVAIALVKASPAPVRSMLLQLRRRLRAMSSSTKTQGHEQLIGTLNYENDVHIQFFRLSRLTRMLGACGMRVKSVASTQAIGGIGGSLIDRRVGIESLVERMPLSIASGWMIVACRD